MIRYVEKIRVPVRIAMRGEQPVAGSLSLAPNVEWREGPESILERLNQQARVVPFHRAPDETVVLLTRRHVEYVAATADVAPELVRPDHYMTTREERVSVRLLGGASFEGVLAMEQPEEFNRASDFLNGDDDFFPLQTADGLVLINKWRVLDVEIAGSGARSQAA